MFWMGPPGLGTKPSMPVAFALIGRYGGSPLTVAAEVTPGRVLTRSVRDWKKLRTAAGSRYTVVGRERRSERTFAGSKPALTSWSFQKAFTIRPEPIRRTRARASSAVTSTER